LKYGRKHSWIVEGALDGRGRDCDIQSRGFDGTAAGEWPSLAERVTLMRPQILRLRADIACFQEVNGQERPSQPRSLLALAELLAGTHKPSRSTTGQHQNN
jgi:hypothetical protein